MFTAGKIYECLNGKKVRMEKHDTYWHGFHTGEPDALPIPYDWFGQPMTADAWEADWGIKAVDGVPIEVKTTETPPKAKDKQVGGDHYKNMKIQPSEFIMANGLNWCEGNAIKYICRHALKHGKADLEKAKHYIDLLIEEKYSG